MCVGVPSNGGWAQQLPMGPPRAPATASFQEVLGTLCVLFCWAGVCPLNPVGLPWFGGAVGKGVSLVPGPNCRIWIGGRVTQKTEVVLKNLQKHFLGEWFAHIQDLAMVTLADLRIGDARMGRKGLAGATEVTPPKSKALTLSCP